MKIVYLLLCLFSINLIAQVPGLEEARKKLKNEVAEVFKNLEGLNDPPPISGPSCSLDVTAQIDNNNGCEINGKDADSNHIIFPKPNTNTSTNSFSRCGLVEVQVGDMPFSGYIEITEDSWGSKKTYRLPEGDNQRIVTWNSSSASPTSSTVLINFYKSAFKDTSVRNNFDSCLDTMSPKFIKNFDTRVGKVASDKSKFDALKTKIDEDPEKNATLTYLRKFIIDYCYIDNLYKLADDKNSNLQGQIMSLIEDRKATVFKLETFFKMSLDAMKQGKFDNILQKAFKKVYGNEKEFHFGRMSKIIELNQDNPGNTFSITVVPDNKDILTQSLDGKPNINRVGSVYFSQKQRSENEPVLKCAESIVDDSRGAVDKSEFGSSGEAVTAPAETTDY